MKTLLFLLSGAVLLLMPAKEEIPHVKGDVVIITADRDSIHKDSGISIFDIDSSFLVDSSNTVKQLK
jgi:hypothetical protein